MSTGELDERRPVEDRERAAAFGAEFGLGTIERVSRSRNLTKSAAWGGVLGTIVFIVGLPAADVRDFTVDYFESDDAAPRLTDFQLTTYAGTTLSGLRGYRHRGEARAVVAEAEQVLAPRLLPAMTGAFESGAPVRFGRVQVSQEGITLSAWTDPGELIPWSQVKSIHLTYIFRRDGDYVHEVIVGRNGMPTREIGVSGLANGIFLPRLLAYAAGRQGVMVTGYRREGGGIPGG